MSGWGLEFSVRARVRTVAPVLESIRNGSLPAEVRVVISDVLDAPYLGIAREFQFRTRIATGSISYALEPNVEAESCEIFVMRTSTWSRCGFHACSEKRGEYDNRRR